MLTQGYGVSQGIKPVHDDQVEQDRVKRPPVSTELGEGELAAIAGDRLDRRPAERLRGLVKSLVRVGDGAATQQIDDMVSTRISMDDALYRRAKAAARRRGISLAELFRQALEETIAKEPSGKPWMAYCGIVEGSPDDSEAVDAVVYGREVP